MRPHLELALIAAFSVACTDFEPAIMPEPPCDNVAWDGVAIRRNIVLIVNDTMRRDAAGAYGGDAATPALDRLARENLVFTHAYSSAPWTKPSVASLMTGLHPTQHGMLTFQRIHEAGANDRRETEALVDTFETLAETLHSAGYSTAGFVGNPWVGRSVGFSQGFEVYDDSLAGSRASGSVIAKRALKWLDFAERDRPFFLYLHFMESHSPYGAIDPSEARQLQVSAEEEAKFAAFDLKSRILANAIHTTDGQSLSEAGLKMTVPLLRLAYRRGIENFDAVLSEILPGLDEQLAPSDTAVIVTSDHGEALYERGWAGHGNALFDDEISIPLVARLPGTSSTNPVTCPVGLVDIMATLCAYVGVECPANQSGVSFLPSPGRAARYIVSEGVVKKPRIRSIRNHRFKLIYDPDGKRRAKASDEPYALFETESDAAERLDLLASAPIPDEIEEVAEILKQELHKGIPPPLITNRTKVVLDPQIVEQLEALGYLDENAAPPGVAP